MKKSIIYTFCIGLFVGAVLALWGIVSFKGNAVKEPGSLYLSRRADYSVLLDSLKPRLKHHWAFDLYAKRLDLERNFKPGHYQLKEGMDVIEVIRMVKLGLQTPVRLVINNVKIPAHLAAKLSQQLDADSVAWMQAFTSQELACEVGCDTQSLFSIFLPDTYEVWWNTTPEDWVRRMKREYDRFWTAERDQQRSRSGLSRLEVMTLASIVYEETRQADEMPRVAGVYLNRLRKGMKLQADPTVKYALQDFGLKRILKKHLKYDSPYNTYVVKGLPPSPICMPSREAVEAVLNYEQHSYLYFCARPTFDGYHNFARTYSEHLKNARRYAAELNKRGIK